jgi:hypothetical protein
MLHDGGAAGSGTVPQAGNSQVQFLVGSFGYVFDLILLTARPLTAMSTRNIHRAGKGGQRIDLTTLSPSCADCQDILAA